MTTDPSVPDQVRSHFSLSSRPPVFQGGVSPQVMQQLGDATELGGAAWDFWDMQPGYTVRLRSGGPVEASS